MTIDVIQPSLEGHMAAFGGIRLFSTVVRNGLSILQAPTMTEKSQYVAPTERAFGARSSLADSALDWVRIVMKPKASPAVQSVLDLPPLDLGDVLHPLSKGDDLLSEMLDDARF